MSNILQQIVETKRQEVIDRRQRTPVEKLKETIETLGRPRNFFQAVTRKPEGKPLNLIAEVKRASPSAGVIRDDFDPLEIARQYHAAGADALSVLTDEKYFQGKLEYIHLIRDAVPLPVLRKDFIIDPYQVYESRAAGADAILLIAECLTTNELIDLQILATELNLTCLIEVHDMDNLMRVRDRVIGFPHKSYSLLGINNRDLGTMTTNIAHTFRLLDIIDDRPIRRVLVSESGITTPADLARLRDHGVNIVLVGEHLMRQDDPEAALRALLNGAA